MRIVLCKNMYDMTTRRLIIGLTGHQNETRERALPNEGRLTLTDESSRGLQMSCFPTKKVDQNWQFCKKVEFNLSIL